ncbi:CwfJ C-terminus 1-domain-containing protein-like protein [Crucibulum laeve]|uniref:CwfJ C-terminus 1-domain-containing protein-like protein n=1 Tax=Crucibulum laeve TaxID=68775 RepID=A0A5C3M8F4_9AGAR|nr:CwfJ C-terminus 1-domain-containing protein-like protein [Crucibulum laeve]
MGKEGSTKSSSSKHEHLRDKDEKKHKKRRKHDGDEERSGRRHKHRKKDTDSGLKIMDDDPNNEDMWVEKNIDMDGERVLATDIPTAESLKLTSSALSGPGDPPLPHAIPAETPIQRDEWMLAPRSVPSVHTGEASTSRRLPTGDESLTEEYGETTEGARTLGGGVDFFSSIGTEVKKKNPKKELPNLDQPIIHSKELNQDLKEGRQMDWSEPVPAPKANTPGGPGSQWRMMRLRRVYETSEEEGIPLEQVAIDRFGSLQAFEDAKEERRILDEREGKRADRDRGRQGGPSSSVSRDGEKRLMFTDIGGSGASSRSSSFRRPAGVADSAPSTPSPPSGAQIPVNRRLDSLRLPSQAASPLAQSHTPIPTVMTPPPLAPVSGGLRALSPSSLNKLQAKVLRAKLMGAPDADKLEKEYEVEARRAQGEDIGNGVKKKVEVLPTLDVRGRLYDVGHGGEDDAVLPGNRKKKEKFETHDPKTGEIIRYNADDDTTTLGEMLRQERFGAGIADQKDLDAQYAKAIMGDGKFQNDLDYIDDNAEKLGRQKMRSDGMKRQFAIHDYKRTQKALASCNFCFGEDDSPPKAPVVAMGTRVYLSCTLTDELVNGHCLIVPIQHHLSMLEGDDDVWDEVKNFMKCLMRMFAEEDKGVVFYETVISLKWQNHTCIECVPLPWEQFELIPGYFKESILMSEAEWSQHKKLIDFGARPGGFRRAMVPNLPYFMVQFDYKGEKGYGHVIEGAGNEVEDGEEGMDEGEKGGGEFPKYFAGEIIGNVLELEPRKWRRPRKIDFRSNKDRVAAFKKKYDKFDWTGMIGRDP